MWYILSISGFHTYSAVEPPEQLLKRGAQLLVEMLIPVLEHCVVPENKVLKIQKNRGRSRGHHSQLLRVPSVQTRKI